MEEKKKETTTEDVEKPKEEKIIVEHRVVGIVPEKNTVKEKAKVKEDTNPNKDKDKEEDGKEKDEKPIKPIKKEDEKVKEPPKDEAPEMKELREKFEAEKKRREELELVVEAEAMKDFEDRKKAFLDLIPDEDERKKLDEKIGDDNERLEEYQRMTSFLTNMLKKAGVKVVGTPEDDSEAENTTNDGNDDENNENKDDEQSEEETESEGDTETKTKTTGKATLPTVKTGAGSYKEYVDTLYAILNDPQKSREEKEVADKKLDGIFFEMIRGINAAHRARKPFAGFSIASCPQCGSPLLGDRGEPLETCPNCGWTLWAKGARRG